MRSKRLFGIFIPLLAMLMLAAVALADPLDSATRITFAPGATSATVSGQVDGNTSASYVIYALAGQPAQITLTYTGGPVYVTFVSPGGSPLARAQAGAQGFSGTLPETGDYSITVSAFSGTPLSAFNLTITIAPLASVATPVPTPVINTQRIQFAPNTNTAQMTGQVSGLTSGPIYNYFLLNAQAGQTMDIILVGFTNPVYLSVISPSGIQLARAQNGVQSYQGVLTESGDYQLRVSTSPGLGLSYYELLAAVVNNGQQPGQQRLQYAPGTSSMTVTGQTSGTWLDSFLLNAQAGQQAQIIVTSPANNVYLTVVSPSGSPLARAQNGVQSFNQALAESGDYNIQISAPAGTAQTNYTVTIAVTGVGSGSSQGASCNNVNQRIQFAPGGTSAQVNGQISATCVDTYVLNAQAGQYMQLRVSSPANNVYLTLVSPGGSPLARAQNGAQTFNGNLPESGDYTIQISAPAGTALTSYLLTVAVSALPQPPPSSGTQRIQFAAGAISAQVTGQVSGTTTRNYVAGARAGQHMQLTLYWVGSPVYLTLVSPSGSPLARAQAGAQGFDGTLPENGDYSIQVSAPVGTPTTSYTLVVTITG
ncbi:MAG TPA: hypothetical protein VHD90_25700 [Phototrophicaceae bacterium]|nr:hypothetical protein [Phototrophicaceae bacterium]